MLSIPLTMYSCVLFQTLLAKSDNKGLSPSCSFAFIVCNQKSTEILVKDSFAVKTNFSKKFLGDLQKSCKCVTPPLNQLRSTEFILESYLVFLEPLLEELLAALLEHRAAQLQGLVLVELALVQQDPKVLEQGRRLARLSGHLLEPLDGLRCPQNALWSKQDGQNCLSVRTMPHSKPV